MNDKASNQKSLIENLFQNLVFKQCKDLKKNIEEVIQQKKQQAFGFYEKLQVQILTCKNQLSKIIKNGSYYEQKTARKYVNALMYLNKDMNYLLEEGILNLYMDLVQFKQKTPNSKQINNKPNLIQKSIECIYPLIYQFFSFRQYKKLQNQRRQNNKLHKLNSLSKKNSDEFTDAQTTPKSSTKISTLINETQMQIIRIDFSKRRLNDLLEQFLDQYQMQIDDLEQTCKICSKKIKINHLEEHVVYCQKKYVLKQDLKSLNNQLTSMLNPLIAQYEKQTKIQNQNTSQNKIKQFAFSNTTFQTQFHQILLQLSEVHKNNVNKPLSSKKVPPSAKIQQNIARHQIVIQKLKNQLQKIQKQNTFYEKLQILLDYQNKILSYNQNLMDIQTQHQNLLQLGSTSTIRPPSANSNCKSDKRSRFALQKKQSRQFCNSQNSQNAQFRQSGIQSGNNSHIQSKDSFIISNQKLKTKQSLGNGNSNSNGKNVQFNVDVFQQEQCQIQKRQRPVRRKVNRVKSLVMFEQDSDQQIQYGQSQINQQSQSTSKPAQNLSLKQFQILKFLGKGAFGKVYAVRRKNTQDLYALKMINIGQNCKQQDFQQIKNQHQIFKKVAGEHLVQAPFCFSEGGIHIFMMEFMPGGDLSKVLEQQIYLQQQRAKNVLAQIILAIQHLHNVDIIHRDLKPQNLVIDQRGHLKLTDFGLSQIKIQGKMQKVLSRKNENQKSRKRMRRAAIVTNKQKVKLIGTPDYIAPEIINGISINNRTIDWWSLGVIAYQIMVGVRPFCGDSIQEILSNITKYNIEWPQIGDQQGMISQNAFDFIKRLLDRDFVNRLGANGVEQIKNHPFFSGVNWNSIKYQNASITPNYAKVRQLIEMPQDPQLRKQIQQKAGVAFIDNNMPKLDNFVRFDILGEKTVKQANIVKCKKTGTLRRLQSIKQFIVDKQNDFQDNQWLRNMQTIDLKKKSKSFGQFKQNCQLSDEEELKSQGLI